MRWFIGVIRSVDMSLSKLQDMVKDRKAWRAAVPLVAKSRTRLNRLSSSSSIRGTLEVVVVQSLSCV